MTSAAPTPGYQQHRKENRRAAGACALTPATCTSTASAASARPDSAGHWWRAVAEICCDTCPYTPTCEEIQDFERDVLHLGDEWGEEPGDA